MDFENDIRDQVLAALPHDRRDLQELRAKSIGELLVIYINWTSRFVVPRPRRIFISGALAAKRPLAVPSEEAALAVLIDMIEQGQDVTAHLSLGVETGFVSSSSGGSRKSGRRDLDLMLNDWGVHHLHLSRAPRADGYVERTGPLLFAVFLPDTAYLIDIVNHGQQYPDAWTSAGVLTVMAKEWPDAGLMLEMRGALPGTNYTDAERRALRRNGYATTHEIDGKAYMPRLGMTSAGTATLTSIKTARILKHLPVLTAETAAGTGAVWQAFDAAGKQRPIAPVFRFRVYIDGYGVAEESTETFVRLASW
jgi:hypothetical protein